MFKQFNLLLLLCFAMVAPAQSAGGGGHAHKHHHVDHKAQEVERKMIRQQIKQWQASVDKKNLDKILDFYTADAILMPAKEPILVGTKIQSYWQRMFKVKGDVFKFTLNRIDISDDMKMAYSVGVLSFVNKQTKKATIQKGKFLMVWKKQNDQWQIVVDSFSLDLPAKN